MLVISSFLIVIGLIGVMGFYILVHDITIKLQA